MLLLFIIIFFYNVLGNEYSAVDELDLNKYIGKWYQVYGDNFNKLFQGDGTCSTAYYQINDDDTSRVSVINSQIDENDNVDTITGYAYYKDGDCCGYLTVSLEGTPDAPYWVLELGPIVDNYYDYAIVSDDKALSLYVLTRDVNRFYKLYDNIVLESLNNFGFTKRYNSPQIMNQTDCIL